MTTATADATGLKAVIDRRAFLDALNAVSPAVPSRSPKPILTGVKLVVSDDGTATLSATDLEIGIVRRVLGVEADAPGAAVLPTARLAQILKSSGDESLSLEVVDDKVVIRGARSKFELQTDNPDLFPDVPAFDASSYLAVAPGDLKRAIRRTIYATDVESTRYALGGCLLEPSGYGTLAMVATDGRRLAMQAIPYEAEGTLDTSSHPVVPVKALKLLDRSLDDEDPPAHLSISTNAVLVRTDMATIYTRLVEGRFPRYRDVFPAEPAARIPVVAGEFLAAVEQASIATSEESRGTDFAFGSGVVRMTAKSADIGEAGVEMPVAYDGPDIGITFDGRYLVEPLRALEPGAAITLELIDAKSAGVVRTQDEFSYVVMPLTRDR